MAQQRCHRCGGSGRMTCTICHGSGHTTRRRWDGSGDLDHSPCPPKMRCDLCGGSGYLDKRDATLPGQGEVGQIARPGSTAEPPRRVLASSVAIELRGLYDEWQNTGDAAVRSAIETKFRSLVLAAAERKSRDVPPSGTVGDGSFERLVSWLKGRGTLKAP